MSSASVNKVVSLDEAVALVVTLGESAGILDGPSRENA